MTNSEDQIEKIIELDAPVSRVWRALTDHEEFGQWFRVKLDGPFETGRDSTGKMTYPGYEGYPWFARVERIEPERLFAFKWFHDAEESGSREAGNGPSTLVEFRLEAVPGGTRLTITESGFSSIPDSRRLEILRGNRRGWDIQAGHIAAHVSA